jgi:trigger factor
VDDSAILTQNAGDPDKAGIGTFDPADHNVEEVQIYLDDANDAERERVLAAEKDGKNRKTLTGKKESK